MGKRVNPPSVGFVVGAIALAVIGVLVFGSGQYFKHTEKFVMFFPGSVNGLSAGAPVKFRGVDIGTVTDIRLVLHREHAVDQGPTVPVYVETDPSKISVDGRPLEMYDPKNLQLLVDRGLRAQLQSQSLVTGLLFVQMDFFPDTPVNYILPQPSTPIEIPTIPTTLELASSAAREIIEELRTVKLGPMVQDAADALEAINRLVSSPALHAAIDALPETMKNVNEAVVSLHRLADDVGGRVGPLVGRLDSTLAGADQTLGSVRDAARSANTIIEPGAPLDHDLRKALQDVSAAARSLARVADNLERNPTAVLTASSRHRRGKNHDQEPCRPAHLARIGACRARRARPRPCGARRVRPVAIAHRAADDILRAHRHRRARRGAARSAAHARPRTDQTSALPEPSRDGATGDAESALLR
jgi:paraquat-inducible protein B